ncbi:hypothetical protein H0W91_00010 [Patescibacteria group bacterium]|nr:hypothetical protein [Patescibacteria group bacterium]
MATSKTKNSPNPGINPLLFQTTIPSTTEIQNSKLKIEAKLMGTSSNRIR